MVYFLSFPRFLTLPHTYLRQYMITNDNSSLAFALKTLFAVEFLIGTVFIVKTVLFTKQIAY
jgi:hypothetical protein